MAARFHVIDSGSTARKVKRWGVVDSGGTTRMIKRAFVIDSGSAARQIFSSAVSFSMTAGVSGTAIGFSFGIFGSVTPSNNQFPDGKDVVILQDESSLTEITFRISALSDPGQSYFTSIFANAAFKASADATYSYNGGSFTAQWVWSGTLFGFTNGNSYPVEIVMP